MSSTNNSSCHEIVSYDTVLKGWAIIYTNIPHTKYSMCAISHILNEYSRCVSHMEAICVHKCSIVICAGICKDINEYILPLLHHTRIMCSDEPHVRVDMYIQQFRCEVYKTRNLMMDYINKTHCLDIYRIPDGVKRFLAKKSRFHESLRIPMKVIRGIKVFENDGMYCLTCVHNKKPLVTLETPLARLPLIKMLLTRLPLRVIPLMHLIIDKMPLHESAKATLESIKSSKQRCLISDDVGFSSSKHTDSSKRSHGSEQTITELIKHLEPPPKKQKINATSPVDFNIIA